MREERREKREKRREKKEERKERTESREKREQERKLSLADLLRIVSTDFFFHLFCKIALSAFAVKCFDSSSCRPNPTYAKNMRG